MDVATNAAEHRASGLWFRPSAPTPKIHGELHWSAGTSPLLDLTNPPSPTTPGLEDEDEEPWLGNLSGYGSVTVLHTYESGINISGTYNRRLTAGLGLLGIHLHSPGTEWISKVEVSHDLLPIVFRPATANHVSSTISDRSKQFDINEGTLDWTIGPINLTITSPTKHTVDAEWGFEVRSGSPKMTLVAATPRSIEWWLQTWLRPIRRVLSLASGRAGTFNWVRLYEHTADGDSTTHPSQAVQLIGRGIGPYESPRPPARERIEPYRLLDRDGAALHAAIQRVRTADAQHATALSFVDAILYSPDRPIESRYLDAILALERLHADLKGLGPFDTSDYKSQRDSARETLATLRDDSHLGDSTHKFIKDNLRNRSEYGLQQRLTHITKMWNLQGDWTKHLRDFAEHRNAIAHGTDPVDATLDLEEAYGIISHLARQVMLQAPTGNTDS